MTGDESRPDQHHQPSDTGAEDHGAEGPIRYEVNTDRVENELEKFKKKHAGDKVVPRVEQALKNLQDDPRPHGCKKLTAVLPSHFSVYRLTIMYRTRIIYQVLDAERLVTVLMVSSREGVDYGRLSERAHNPADI